MSLTYKIDRGIKGLEWYDHITFTAVVTARAAAAAAV